MVSYHKSFIVITDILFSNIVMMSRYISRVKEFKPLIGSY